MCGHVVKVKHRPQDVLSASTSGTNAALIKVDWQSSGFYEMGSPPTATRGIGKSESMAVGFYFCIIYVRFGYLLIRMARKAPRGRGQSQHCNMVSLVQVKMKNTTGEWCFG
jgi:hypothetical protein